MRRMLGLLLLCALAGGLACGRHHVVARSGERLDGAASTLSKSDPDWTIEQEPAANEAPAQRR